MAVAHGKDTTDRALFQVENCAASPTKKRNLVRRKISRSIVDLVFSTLDYHAEVIFDSQRVAQNFGYSAGTYTWVDLQD
jgi:hypothetical protein